MPSIRLSRRSRIAIGVVVGLIVLLVVLTSLVGVYTNYLWFGELHLHSVYRTILLTRLVLFVIFGVLMSAILGANLVVAYRLRPPFRPMSAEQQNLERYRVALEPRKKLILVTVMVLSGLAAGASAQGDWRTWSLWLHGVRFGVQDQQFHRDISFFAWDYPAYRLMLSFGFLAVIFAIVLSAVVYYLVGAIRLQTPGPKFTLSARRHMTILIFLFITLKAIAYWLDRYGLVFSDRGNVTGASYTDVNASLPAKTILFWIAIIIAAGVLASLWLKSPLLPGIGFVVLLILAIVINGIYPAIIQQFTVKPNASTKEAQYISRNITATRQAYGIVSSTDGGNVTYQDYSVDTSPLTSALTNANPTVANLRILDPNVVSPTFQKLQQIRNQYGFATKLDVDRYTVDGTTNDYIVGTRELDEANLVGDQTNWINAHTVYTHGYGFVAAAASSDVTNTKVFTEGGIPPSGPLDLTDPDIYYGELLTNYSIVGAEGTPREYDAFDGKSTYTGTGGIPLSNFLTRLAFGVKYRETNFLLNDAASAKGARIIFDRDPRTRVEKVAPFLTVDGDPYPAVVGGRVVWIVDAYTTMANYPYSERQNLSDLTTDSLTQANRTAGQASTDINYIRNSVKATVDALDGTVTLYQWDKTDPVLQSWMKIFPGLINTGPMPAEVMAHVRYPQDLFEVQRSLLQQYHVTDPVQFYNVGDKWTVPNDPNVDTTDAVSQPPYYVLADTPEADTPGGGASSAEFQLTTPMKVNNSTNLAAYISVDSDPGPNYGKMTVLRVTNSNAVQGPEQIANTFRSNAAISQKISLLDQGGSSIIHGNLLTLPVGNSFLYIEPVYVQSSGGQGYPLLQLVLAAYGDDIGYSSTLAGALQTLSPNCSSCPSAVSGGTQSSSPPSSPTTTPPATGTTTTPTTPATSTAPAGSVDAILTQLDQAFAALSAAYASGDPAAVGQAEARIKTLAAQYEAARSASTTGPTPTK